jgi:hypothetical protein
MFAIIDGGYNDVIELHRGIEGYKRWKSKSI